MNFLALSPLAAYALLATVAALIVLMYWLKARPRRVRVASNLIWRKLDQVRRPALNRWRWWLSLLLALVTGLSIALALSRPQAPAVGGVAQRLVLVLDNSPSMAARGADGVSRWEHALARAQRIISGAGLASEVMLLDTLGRMDTPQWVSRDSALAHLRRISSSSSGSARMPLIPVDEHSVSYLLSDGVASLDVPPEVAIEPVFAPADNVAITAFDARPALRDPTRYQALVQVFNASARTQQVRLAITGGKDFVLERELQIAAGAIMNQTVDVSAYAAGVLRAQVHAPGDGFEFDDVAYAVVAPHRTRRVLLVSAGNRQLQASIEALPGVALTRIAPARYRQTLDYDAYVFDRFAPQAPPAQGALLFRPPPAAWLPVFERAKADPVITRWDPSHPLALNVPWRSVQLQRAALTRIAGTDAQTDVMLASGADEGVLVAAGTVPSSGMASGGMTSRWIATGFAIEDSNFATQAAFTVFLGNALGWLENGTETLYRGLGYVEIPHANARVTAHDGRVLNTISVAGVTIFEAARPGVFAVTTTTGTMQVIANVLDPLYADINRSRFNGASATPAPAREAARFGFEPWVALLALAALLLAAEWLAYTRRISV